MSPYACRPFRPTRFIETPDKQTSGELLASESGPRPGAVAVRPDPDRLIRICRVASDVGEAETEDALASTLFGESPGAATQQVLE